MAGVLPPVFRTLRCRWRHPAAMEIEVGTVLRSLYFFQQRAELLRFGVFLNGPVCSFKFPLPDCVLFLCGVIMFPVAGQKTHVWRTVSRWLVTSSKSRLGHTVQSG